MTMTMSGTSSNNHVNAQFGDTTLTKVFVGGLAWETPKDAMKAHFEKYGEILEAVIISDKLTGRSKGYGFVTFKDGEAAKKACEDATPTINGRRANCNLAALGARRPPRSASATPPLPQGASNGGAVRPGHAPALAAASQMQWYYPVGGSAPAASSFHHQHHQAVPFYGYSPAYVATGISYNHKVSYNGGGYMNVQNTQMYTGQAGEGQAMMGATSLTPMYHPVYPYQQQHQSPAMGLPAPAHLFPPTWAGPLTTSPPAFFSKPTSLPPTNPGGFSTGESLKKGS